MEHCEGRSATLQTGEVGEEICMYATGSKMRLYLYHLSIEIEHQHEQRLI